MHKASTATELHHCMDCGVPEGYLHHRNCASFERDLPIGHPVTRKGSVGGKQARYQDQAGDDWIDEFARTATPEEFRGAMRFTIGKYNRRAGKKDALTSEIRKMQDYCGRWLAYEEGGQ